MGQTLSEERYIAMGASEQFILTLSEKGYGKRSSSHEYRVSGRGGKGIAAMAVNSRNGKLVSSFPVDEGDEVMLVTDGGQLIRCPVPRHPHRPVDPHRALQSLIRLRMKRLVSVERITETEEGEDPELADEKE